ncbi:phosphotransferase [Pseudonocardia kujensis]|uniref:phosphotransferase n=1 Tax=Pseudonocardia kujensis TaxID=1128675 RepID=UPI001E59B936|nr:phosphotransferase [Pseudonocardia kujensis]MCE0767541.1 phosphotransferase [Pseudonocardia kujensis]
MESRGVRAPDDPPKPTAPRSSGPRSHPSPSRTRGGLVRGSLIRSAAHRDGLALILGSGLTSAVGLVYWVLAARLFPADVVGLNQAALSAVMLLGSVAHLNMTYALLRFVPVAGWAARRLVIGGYLAAGAIAALVGLAFATGARWWAPDLVAAVGQDRLTVFFVLATPVWALFTVQDYVLTGIRRATVVPLENGVFAVLKVGLLLAALVATVTGAVAVSWMVATALLVLVVNVWLLARALPRFTREHEAAGGPVERITVRDLGGFVRADYAGAIFQQAAMFGMPVLVLGRLGPEANGAYGIVWQIAQALFVVSSGMNQSMVAHTAADAGSAETVEAARRATIRRSLTLVLPGALVVAAGAPLILSVFGAGYAREGTAALALTALAAVPYAVTSATVSAARVRRRGVVQFAVPAAAAILVIGGSWVLLPVLGIVGAGLAWLVGQSLVALVIMLGTARWLPPVLARRVDALRSAGLLRRIGGAGTLLHGVPGGAGWTLGERLSGGSESVVVRVGPEGGAVQRGALLKACDTPRSRRGLAWQTEVLDRLHADPRIGHLHPLLPRVLGAGEIGRSYCVIESLVPGESGLAVLRDPVRGPVLVDHAAQVIGELHRHTGEVRPVGPEDLDAWVHEPLSRVRALVPRALHADTRGLAARLDAALRGRRASVGWVHGDFSPVNLLADPRGRVSGIVDWCEARPVGLQVLDVVALHQFAVMHGAGRELGPLVLEWLAGPPDAVAERMGAAQRLLGGDPVDHRVLTVLGWLQHVSEVARKSARASANPVWVRRNVRAPLRGARAALEPV